MSHDPKKALLRWNSSSAIKKSDAIKVAEPMHRVPPPGATSSQSFRSVTKSSLQLVKEICLHYVQKCAGQYSDNKAAARYVHQMAEEIIFQLGGVANEIKRTRGEPELYQALLDEWNEHFPASLGAIGSPKAIAQLVASQSKEIQRLKMELETEKINRENDVSGILRSMDAQLHTYRTSVMNDRKQQKNLYDHQLADRDDKAKKMKDSYELQIENIQDDHKCSMSALQKEYEELLKKCRDDHDKLANTFEMRLKDHKNKTQVKINKLRDKLILWEEKCMEIKGKYNELAAALSEDVISNSDLELPSDSDSDSEDSECEISNNMDIGEEFNVDVNETRRLVSERREKARNDAREKRPKREKPVRTPIPPTSNSDNSIAEKLKQLQESNLILSAQVKRMEKRASEADVEKSARQKEIQVLTDKLQELMEERKSQIKKIKAMEELTEALRRALVVRVEPDGQIDFPSVEKLQSYTDVLCHTPHFLDHPDRTAPSQRSQPILSGYKLSGHF